MGTLPHVVRSSTAFSVASITLVSLLLSLCAIAPVHSVARLVGRGFSDVTVLLDSDLPAENSKATLLNLQAVLEKTSEELYRATGNKTYISDVKVYIPQHWRDIPSGIDVQEGLPQTNFDIVVSKSTRVPLTLNDIDTSNPLSPPKFNPKIYLSHAPRTLHASNVCSRKGSHIVVPVSYVDNYDNLNFIRALGDPGKQLAVDWAKYQWGIFDEHGYLMDKSFPFLIRDSSDPGINGVNGCFQRNTNKEKHFVNMLSDNGESCTLANATDAEPGTLYCFDPFKCMLVPTRETQSRSPTSLLHQPFWSKVTEFCNETTHDTKAITPQNLFCEKQSVWTVLNRHKHFESSSTWSRNLTSSDIKPTIQFIRPVLQNVIFAVDVSSSMNKTRLKIIRTYLNSTLTQFNRDPAVHVGLVTFARRAVEVVKPRSIMDPRTVDAIVEAIPLDGDGPTCPDCAIDLILPGILQSTNNTEVVVITDGYATELRNYIVDGPIPHHPSIFVLDEARAAIVKFHAIYYGTHPKVFSTLQILGSMTGTTPFFLPVGSVQDSVLGSYLESVLKPYLIPKQAESKSDGASQQGFETKLEITGAMTKQIVRIPLPESTVLSMSQLSFVITYEKAVDFVLDAARISQDGRRLSRSTVIKHLSAANRVEFELNVALRRVKRGAAVLELYTKGQLSGTLRRAQPGTPIDKDMSVSAWIGGSEANEGLRVIKSKDLPLEIHARVVGSSWRPLTEIPAVLVRLISRGGAVQELSLKDNGLDPDYKAGDGIYSGFLIDIEQEGSHYMDVQIYHPSHMKPMLAPGVKLLMAEPTLSSSLVEIKDRIAPSRITDLKLQTSADGQHAVALTWTAPGDDATRGKATEYLLQYFTDVSAVSRAMDLKSLQQAENRITAKLVSGNDHDLLVPFAAGHEEYIDLTESNWIQWLTSARDTVYFIVRAVDEAGNVGKVSNVATWVKDPQCYLPPTAAPADSSSAPASAGTIIKGAKDNHKR